MIVFVSVTGTVITLVPVVMVVKVTALMVSLNSRKVNREDEPVLVTLVPTVVSVMVVGFRTVTGGRAGGVLVTRNVVVSVKMIVFVKVTGTVTTDEAYE